MSIEAWLYDGESANRHDVRVARSGGDLRIDRGEGLSETIAAATLVHVENRGVVEVYGRNDRAGWRLGITAPAPDLAAILPGRQRYGRWVDRVGLVPAVLIGVAVSGLTLFVASKAPEWIAPSVPVEWEAKFGDALVGDLDDRTCNRPESQAILDRLVAQLSPRHREFKVRVADFPMVNAVALPGGNIVIFKELLLEAESPDEAAGVIAHEIAHIENRDVTQAMIRHYGLSVLLTGLGGSTGGNIDTLLTASYSREAETQADRDAIAALGRAGISPAATARFFGRMAKAERTVDGLDYAFSYFSTHPLSEDRRRLFHDAAEKGRAYRLSLNDADWRMLQDICWPEGQRPKPVE